MNAKHTVTESPGFWTVVAPTGIRLCTCSSQATVQQIAAALDLQSTPPELLSACQAAYEARHFSGYELEAFVHNSGVLEQLAAAITKAKPISEKAPTEPSPAE